MKIVVIDDDPDAQAILTMCLASEGYKTYSAYTGLEGLKLTQQYAPDLVILDIQLPEMSGWDTCKQIRSFSSVPVLMISSVAKEDVDIVYGLNIGADDYFLKPIRPKIIQARVNALLRRSANIAWRQSHQAYVDAHLKVDLYRQELIVQGERVPLSFLEYRLLELLVRNVDQAVPTLELIEGLWEEGVPDDYARYIRIYIGRLRKRIEHDSRNPKYIVTEHGFGYRFVPQT